MEEKGFALIEMFTSEGYRNFRSTDKQLEWIEKTGASRNLPIYTLAFHVDRFDSDEFRDPFSSSEASVRQQAYAEIHARGSVSAPLVMINGETRLPGKRNTLKEYINLALGSNPSMDASAIQAKAMHSGSDVKVRWQWQGWKADDRLNIALVQKTAANEIASGDRAGSTVNHINVVRDYKVVQGQELASTEASALLKMPEDVSAEQFHVIAYVQNTTSGAVRSVSLTQIEAGAPKPEMTSKDGSTAMSDASTTTPDGSSRKTEGASAKSVGSSPKPDDLSVRSR